MSDEVNQSVETDVAPPSDAAEQPAPQDSPQESTEQTPARVSDEERNWKEARRIREETLRENRELRAELDRLKISQQPAPQTDELANLRDDDIVTVLQAKKLSERHAKSVAEKVIREREAATLGDRISAIYPDFDEVVSPENVETLRTSEPELYAGLQRLADDPLSQAKGAYKLLKRLGKGESDDMARNKAKIAENSKKPVSVQSVTKASSAIGDVHKFDGGLTPDLKKQLYREMTAAAKAK
jgi:hypothetical protein